jgi:hypothetical protein
MTDHSQLTTVWRRQENQLPSAFIFQPGPADWPEGKTLDLGRLGGVELEVLKFYRHARTEEAWVEDPAHKGDPVIQLALGSADGTPMVQQWLAADPFADEVFLGPVRLAFQRAPAASMLEDFINPPSEDKEKKTDGFRCGRTWGRRSPWARATFVWRSPPTWPMRGPMRPPTSHRPATSRRTRSWN